MNMNEYVNESIEHWEYNHTKTEHRIHWHPHCKEVSKLDSNSEAFCCIFQPTGRGNLN